MFCKHCGSELIDGMAECPKCWTPINENDKLKYVNNETENTYEFITLGSYNQYNDTSNGKEDIEWRVLAKEDNRILLISEYALDCQPYNTEWKDVTWENCTLRKWLNNDFLNEAFSKEEQAKIQSTTVTADTNPEYSADPGNDTTDKVFLLSIAEVEKYFSSYEDIICKPGNFSKFV